MAINPTLAVWMPNFNHCQYIGRAIDAIATQSRRSDQFFIIDDSSTDNSRKVIDGYVKKYPWITVVYQEKNTGVLAIMNKGVREITADYVLMSSADDYILSGFFETAMNAVQQYPEAGIIFGQMRVENNKDEYLYTGRAKNILNSQFLSPSEYMQSYLKQEPVTQSLSAASIYKVSALRDVGGFYEELGPWCDTFALQAMALKNGAYYIAQPVSVWVVHSFGVSQAVRSQPGAMFAVIKKAIELMKSPEFTGLFPASYIRTWAFKYRVVILLRYLVAISPRLLQKWYAFVIYKLILICPTN